VNEQADASRDVQPVEKSRGRPGSPALPGHERRLLACLLGILAAGQAARSLAPTLLVRAPLLLALLDGRTASLLLLRERLGLFPFVLATSVGMSLADPFAFALGRRQGEVAIAHVRRWLPATGRLLLVLESVMGRFNGAPVALFSGYGPCALAGAAGVSWPRFLVFNALGVSARLIVVLLLGQSLGSELDAVGRWVSLYSLPLTAVTVLLAGIDCVVRRRRRRD
jgi:membrane protein DedA with SNARE-associated domain